MFLFLSRLVCYCFFFFSSRRRHTSCGRDWSSDVCSSDLTAKALTDRGVPFFTSHTIQSAGGRTGEIESVRLVAVNRDGTPVAGGERDIACDSVCWAVGLVPN